MAIFNSYVKLPEGKDLQFASSVCEGLKGPGGEKRRQALAAKACATYRASCDVAF